MMTDNPTKKPVRSVLAATMAAFAATVLALPAHAATDLPRVPPTVGEGVAPNIMFILDDSGSMHSRAMPADRRHGNSSPGNVLADNHLDRSYIHNSIYYNPLSPGLYRGWITINGDGVVSRYPDTPATDVHTHPVLAADISSDRLSIGLDLTTDDDLTNSDQTFFILKDGAVDLNDPGSFIKYILQSGGTSARSCTYSGANDWASCTQWSTERLPWGRSVAQEWQNFANWYSYHRTRMKVAKAGAGEAFSGAQNTQYRIGYDTIHNRNAFWIDQQLGSNDGRFTGGNRETWYKRLYGASADGYTPLHTALDRAGEYYQSEKPYGGSTRPDGSLFECRRNFSILTTDGFWNRGQSGTGIGNADGEAGSLISAPVNPDGTPGQTYQYQPQAPYTDSHSTTLADVAMHYWKTDLRPTMDNIVQGEAFWQNMTTFGISIGLRGTLPYTSVREVLEAGPFTWPNPMDGPDLGDAHRIDDLLHAAVNGRGEFVSAGNPEAFSKGLREALDEIARQTSSRSNVAASSTSISTSTRLFQARYLSGDWSGDVLAYPVTTAGVDDDSPIWQASKNLPAWSDRKIHTTDAAGSRGTFPTPAQNTALGFSAGGYSIADYIKGNDAGEVDNGGDLRSRSHPLGDIIHSSPHYVEENRILYVGGNDGMLHAFDDEQNGREVFAYVPRGIAMADLKTLSSPAYDHQYFVDGPVVVSDRETTITGSHPQGRYLLAGTLGHGGKGVYALDVTAVDGSNTFSSTNVLFDMTRRKDDNTDVDLGLVMGHPFIAATNDGSVSVIFGNGINSGSEKAVLYVVNVGTGAVSKIDTGAAGNNGLSAPVGWDEDGNGTVDVVYAGDQKGNLWKFNLSQDNTTGKKWSVGLGGAPLMTATDAAGNPQPINGRPAVGVDPVLYRRWVFFGTGSLLTNADVTDKSVQTMYGIIDSGSAIGTRAANDDQSLRTGLVERSFKQSGVIDGKPVRSFESHQDGIAEGKRGWFVDLLAPPEKTAEGERIIGAAQVVGPIMLVSSIIPDDDPCGSNGRGYINAIDAYSGTSVGGYFFDVDLDGQYSDDQLNGDPVGSIDTNVGMNTDAVLIDKLVAVGGSGGSGGMAGSAGANNQATSGRISWRENLGK